MGRLSKSIKLSGKFGKCKTTIVDAEDYSFLNGWKWYLTKKGYVARTWHSPRPARIDRTIFMHKVINGTPDNYETDHINRNKLDNRRCNLRTVTNTQNQLNKGLQKNNKSGHIGVSKRPNGKWWARIYVKRKMFSLGCYENLIDAVEARKNFIYE